jgi:mannose-6-phosphate isomerase-like protein (cupin superfamily)
MKKILILFLMTASIVASAQGVTHTDTIKAPVSDQNYVQALYSDSLSSSFLIVIPKEVKAHYHAHHTEQIVVISGEADLILGSQVIHIKAGDVIFIPKNTQHSLTVTSLQPLRVVSIQAPIFDGTDRVTIGK